MGARVIVIAGGLMAIGGVPAGCATPSGGPVILSETNAGARQTVPVGSSVTLRLPAQPGTGYAWQANPAPGLAIVSETMEPGAAIPGGTSTAIFVVQVTAPGEHLLVMHYSQPWPGGAKDGKVLRYTLIGR